MSFFWSDTTAGYNELNLRQSWSSLSENKDDEVNLLLHNYLTALGTGNENTSRNGRKSGTTTKKPNFHLLQILPERSVPQVRKYIRGTEVRGSIVNFQLKGPKPRFSINRAYSTTSNKMNSSHSLTSENTEEYLGFEKIARL